MARTYLDFEKPVAELEAKVAEVSTPQKQADALFNDYLKSLKASGIQVDPLSTEMQSIKKTMLDSFLKLQFNSK